MRLEDCLPKVREGAKLLWTEGERAYFEDCLENYSHDQLMSNNWSVEKQPKKIEELAEFTFMHITTKGLVVKINEIIRELNRRMEK